MRLFFGSQTARHLSLCPMPGSADFVQRTVHALEAGGAAKWIVRLVVALLIIGLCCSYLLQEFRGLGAAQGMDQAQIGRELIRGHGWATQFARPLAAGQLQSHGKNAAQKVWIDTYNAPLPPLVDAIALLPVKGSLKMTPRDIDYKLFGGQINAIYLTPISGSQNTLRDILKGEYRDWAQVILRSLDLSKFPLKWATLLGLDNERVFFSDHDRQQINTHL